MSVHFILFRVDKSTEISAVFFIAVIRHVFENTESTPRGGVNRCKANLMNNNAELKT